MIPYDMYIYIDTATVTTNCKVTTIRADGSHKP